MAWRQSSRGVGCGKIRVWGCAVVAACVVAVGGCARTGGVGGEGSASSADRVVVGGTARAAEGGNASGLGVRVREEVRPELERHMAEWGAEGVFVLLDEARGVYIRTDPERAGRREVPASTFKIPNALIGLETGVLADEREVIAWDGTERQVSEWNRDHTLASAFKVSAVWFYQEVARRVGEERMGEWVRRLGFGNADISGGIDQFWLTGGLRISADEQIAFLRRLERGELPLSGRSMGIVREIMRMEETESYVLRGKTGWAPLEGVHYGWLVGWVEKAGGVHYYALQVESRAGDFPMVEARPAILRGILADLGVL